MAVRPIRFSCKFTSLSFGNNVMHWFMNTVSQRNLRYVHMMLHACSRVEAHYTLDCCPWSLGSSSARFWIENHWSYWRWRWWYRIWAVQLTTPRNRWISWWIQTKLEVSRMASPDRFCCTVLSRSIFDAASCLCQWFSQVCILFSLCKTGRSFASRVSNTYIIQYDNTAGDSLRPSPGNHPSGYEG